MTQFLLGKSKDDSLRKDEYDTVLIESTTTDLEKHVYLTLSTGKDNNRSQKELANLNNCSPRIIGATIQSLRRKGYPICSSRKGESYGYYKPANLDEFNEYQSMMWSNITEMLKTYRIQQFNAYGLQNGSQLPTTLKKIKSFLKLRDVKRYLND